MFGSLAKGAVNRQRTWRNRTTKIGLGKHLKYLLDNAQPSVGRSSTRRHESARVAASLVALPTYPINFKWPHHKLGRLSVPLASSISQTSEWTARLAEEWTALLLLRPRWKRANRLRGTAISCATNSTSLTCSSELSPPAAVQTGFDCEAEVPTRLGYTVLGIRRVLEGLAVQRGTKRGRPLAVAAAASLPATRYLLGYPLNSTLAYDPTPGPKWWSLLTLGSDFSGLDWCWHDGDWLGDLHRENAISLRQLLAD